MTNHWPDSVWLLVKPNSKWVSWHHWWLESYISILLQEEVQHQKVVSTEFGTGFCHVALSPLRVVYIQRHHLEVDIEYRQPRKIN